MILDPRLQPVADRFAVLANARMATMLQLRSTTHLYDPEPGDVNSISVAGDQRITLKHWRRAEQPYRDLTRFTSDERVMQHVIDRGLLPVVTALAKESLGKKVLLTRRPAPRPTDRGVLAYLAGYGMRIEVYFDPAAEDTIVAWECLYASA